MCSSMTEAPAVVGFHFISTKSVIKDQNIVVQRKNFLKTSIVI